MKRTRNELREQRNEALTVVGIVLVGVLLVWVGFELRGALEVMACI